ncbi:MAG: dihydropteroate synthase [Thermovirgaceae bacterium]
MTPYVCPIRSASELKSILVRLEADMRSLPYFEAKRKIIPLYIRQADFRAANALKQEMLSRGGDAAVHRNAIQGTVSFCDVLLLGTLGQYRSLIQKLEAMPYWGLETVREGLARTLSNLSLSAWTIPMPHGGSLNLSDNPLVMGIINVTPDSFFAASRVRDIGDCVRRASQMQEEGMHILDLGAESTRPGSDPVSEDIEKQRIIPVIKALRESGFTLPISVDTVKASVAEAATRAGADIINDVSAGRMDPSILDVVASGNIPYVCMHMKGIPKTMQKNPTYENLIGEIISFFEERIDFALSRGMDLSRIMLDPGLGFGKTREHNLAVLKNLESFRVLGRPLLIGHSNKSTIGKVLDGAPEKDRLEGTLAVTALCAWEGVSMVRVHDVRENLRVIRMIRAVKEASL